MTSGIDDVLEGGTCAGCGACTTVTSDIAMFTSEAGFLRPSIERSLSPHERSRFDQICPSVSLTAPVRRGASQHDLWGPIVAARRGWATDDALRHAGASGAGLTALLIQLVEDGTVDAVLHVTAAVDPPYGNRIVVSTSAEEIAAGAGSRYAPSAPLDGIAERLGDPRRYAFVGKPCDVAALRRLAAIDARYDERFPVMLSFFCAGVPSVRGAEQIIERLGVDSGDVEEFRYRGNGWPGRATATLIDGSQHSMSYADSWGGVLSRHVQLRCTICPDGVGQYADVACADAWVTDRDGYPVFEEAQGVSAVISRTELGERLVQNAVAGGRLATAALDIDELDAMQPGQVGKATKGPARLAALRVLRRPTPRFHGFSTARRMKRAGPVETARQVVGTVRRARRGKLRT